MITNIFSISAFASVAVAAIVSLVAAEEPPVRRHVVPETPEESAPVTLEGDVRRERHYGPPNYGETPERDRIEEAVILRLRQPLCASREPGAACGGQDVHGSIHLVLSREGLAMASIEGCVAVTGPLFRAHTGHHRRAILMSVDRAEPC